MPRGACVTTAAARLYLTFYAPDAGGHKCVNTNGPPGNDTPP